MMWPETLFVSPKPYALCRPRRPEDPIRFPEDPIRFSEDPIRFDRLTR